MALCSRRAIPLALLSAFQPRVCKTIYNPCHPNIDDTDSEDDRRVRKPTANPSKTWMNKWKAYMNTNEDVPEGMEVVCWWGVSISYSICVHHWLVCRCMALAT